MKFIHTLKIFTLLLISTATQAAVSQIAPQDLLLQLNNGTAPIILDVRTEQEFREGHIQGAMHIPFDEIIKEQQRVSDYKDKEIIVYCRSGRRAGVAEQTLKQLGFSKLIDLKGHMIVWKQLSYPLVKGN